MSITRLPSGRYRAQVHDCHTGTNVSVSRVLPDTPGTFATRNEAEAARTAAREYLAARPKRWKRRRPAPPSVAWCLASKGETACRACGEPASHLHHIVPKILAVEAKRDWQRNGVPLCTRCHRGWHNRAVELQHDILTDIEFASACELAGQAWVERHYTGSRPVADRYARIPRRLKRHHLKVAA